VGFYLNLGWVESAAAEGTEGKRVLGWETETAGKKGKGGKT